MSGQDIKHQKKIIKQLNSTFHNFEKPDARSRSPQLLMIQKSIF